MSPVSSNWQSTHTCLRLTPQGVALIIPDHARDKWDALSERNQQMWRDATATATTPARREFIEAWLATFTEPSGAGNYLTDSELRFLEVCQWLTDVDNPDRYDLAQWFESLLPGLPE